MVTSAFHRFRDREEGDTGSMPEANVKHGVIAFWAKRGTNPEEVARALARLDFVKSAAPVVG